MNIKKISIGLLFLILALVVVPGASALPAYATATGASCGTCHVNPSGGGTLTADGTYFKANGQLPPTPVATPVPTPVATPVPTPVATPVPTPVATQVPTPVDTLIPTPVDTAVLTPTSVLTPILEEDEHHNGVDKEVEHHRVHREKKHHNRVDREDKEQNED